MAGAASQWQEIEQPGQGQAYAYEFRENLQTVLAALPARIASH
jgi:hypothetical protein